MGGISDSLIPHKSNNIKAFHGMTEETPICFSIDNLHVPIGCLPLSYRTFLTDSPVEDFNKTNLWSLEMNTLRYANYNDSKVNIKFPILKIL